MLKYLMASAMVVAFAGTAFAQMAPAGGVAGTTSANPLAFERAFSATDGASIFGGRSQGAFGSLQALTTVVAVATAVVIYSLPIWSTASSQNAFSARQGGSW